MRLLSLLLLLNTAAGEEIRIRDLRLQLGGGPGPDHVTDNYTTGPSSAFPSQTYSEHLDGGSSALLRLGYHSGHLGSGGGFIWGAGIQGRGGSATFNLPASGVGDFTWRNFGPFGTCGYGHSMGPYAHFEVGPFLSFGAATATWYDEGSSGFVEKESGGGFYLESGIDATVHFCIARRFVLGVEGGYEWSSSAVTVDFATTGGHSGLTFATSGPFIATSIGYRFGG